MIKIKDRLDLLTLPLLLFVRQKNEFKLSMSLFKHTDRKGILKSLSILPTFFRRLSLSNSTIYIHPNVCKKSFGMTTQFFNSLGVDLFLKTIRFVPIRLLDFMLSTCRIFCNIRIKKSTKINIKERKKPLLKQGLKRGKTQGGIFTFTEPKPESQRNHALTHH